LTLRNLDKTISNVHFHAATEVDEILARSGAVDLAVVLVKGTHTKIAAEKAAKLIQPNKGFVLTLQNGLGNREIIAEVVGDDSRVLQGVTSNASYMVESGHVWHTGLGSTAISFNSKCSLQVKKIAEMLTAAGFPCELTDNLEGMLWGKLIVNAGINPLTAILRVKNGVLASSETCRDILGMTVKEGVHVATARGVSLPFENPTESVLAVARATGDNLSSMLVDVMRGRKTEVDSINGAIVREGEKLGVSVLLNKSICHLLSLLEPPQPSHVTKNVLE